MGQLIKRFPDGSFLEYDRGGFDDWCVYLTDASGNRKPPRDTDYFAQLKRDSGDYDSDHACQKCGTCEAMDFEGDVCDYCGYCRVCCEQATADMGCTHGICVKDPQFKEHYCYKHHQCIEKCDHDPCTHENLKSGYQKDEKYHWQICADCGAVVKNEKHNEDTSVIVTAPDPVNKKKGLTRYSCSVCGQDMGAAVIPYAVPAHDHKYNTGGYCTICGEKAQGEPYIVRDPRSVSRITPTLEEIEAGTVDPVVFSVKAKGDEPLYYQWYKYNSVTGTSEAMIGEMESTLSIPLEQDCCQVDYFEYYCDVSNEKGNATSARAKLQIRHNWKGYISVADGGTVTVPDPEYRLLRHGKVTDPICIFIGFTGDLPRLRNATHKECRNVQFLPGFKPIK